jgi:CRISPR-associated protein (TIGR02710 family)
MPSALIISVGGSPEPLVFSIQERSPECVCFLVSQQSVDLVGEIKQRAARPFADYKVIVDDAEDLTACYQKALECFDWIENRLAPGTPKVVDVTGGTKAMTAALAIAAIARGAVFSYVGGERRDKGGLGVVETGSERLRESFNPWELFAVEAKRDIAGYFNGHQFEAAAATAAGIIPKLPEPDRSVMDPIRDAALAYAAWDRFDHPGAIAPLKEANRKLSERLPLVQGRTQNTLANFHEQLAHTLNALNNLRGRTKNFTEKHPLMAADLVANGARRMQEDRNDDAVARLYRALEMIGQCAFETRFHVSTGKVPPEIIPARIRAEYEDRYRDPDEPLLKLPLFATFRVLRESNDPLGARFAEDGEQVQKIMSARNDSILAHGGQPVKRQTAEKFIEIVVRYLPTGHDLVKFPRLSL